MVPSGALDGETGSQDDTYITDEYSGHETKSNEVEIDLATPVTEGNQHLDEQLELDVDLQAHIQAHMANVMATIAIQQKSLGSRNTKTENKMVKKFNQTLSRTNHKVVKAMGTIFGSVR